MKYSKYSRLEIITPIYQDCCIQILDMITDREIKKKCRQILYNGGYKGFSVNSRFTKNNPSIEREKRVQFAYLLASNPEMFDIMIKHNVNLFHGTNFNAVPKILQYGMKSGEALLEMGETVETGEYAANNQRIPRDFISFTDDLSLAMRYSTIPPRLSSEKSSLTSFGVLIGISSDDAKNMEEKFLEIVDDIEMGIVDNVPLDKIKLIAVPKNQVEFVRKLINDDRIAVTSVEVNGSLYNSIGCLANAKDRDMGLSRLSSVKTNTSFDSNAVGELSKTRTLSGIQSVFRRLHEKYSNRWQSIRPYAREPW